MGRLSQRGVILPDYSHMHTAGVFLVGIAIAAVIAILVVSKQSDALRDEIVVAHASRDKDQPH
jgi:hypothetical protein